MISFASNQRSARSRKLGGVVEDHTPEAQFEAPYDPLHPISYYAMAAQKYLHRYGGTHEQLAEIAVAAREWALLNPAAYRYGQGSITAADVVGARPVSSPLTVADCCLVTDGGGAVVLTSAERARDLRRAPVTVMGYGERSTNTSMTAVDDLTFTGAAGSGADAFRRAGITTADVDVLEVYDSFTITAALSIEMLGFCGRGEVLDFIQDGRIRPGGDAPSRHLRRRVVLLPPRPVRHPAPRRGGAAAARRVWRPTGAGRADRRCSRNGRDHVHPRDGGPGGGCVNTDVPAPDDVTAEWWEATRQHQLLVQVCDSCKHRQHPPRAVCTSCGSTEHLASLAVTGRGVVDSWTEVHRPPRPDVEAPYVVARVRLEEGPLLLSRLDGDAPWQIDEPVTVDWFDLPDGRALPVFRRA